MSKSLSPRVLARKEIGMLNQLKRSMKPVSIEESVHEFRVQYKKTRAFYRMANAVEDDNQHCFKKSWKRIYKVTGQLRDTSLLMNLVKQQFGDGNLLLFLESENMEYENTLQQELKKAKPFAITDEKWKTFNKEGVDNYFRNLLLPVVESHQPPITDRQLHRIRKNLKDFLYNLNFLDEMNIVYPAVVTEIKISAIDNLLHLLGDYQDQVVQSIELRRLRMVPELHDNLVAIDEYLHHLAHQQTLLHNEIDQVLKHFLHLHTTGTLNQ